MSVIIDGISVDGERRISRREFVVDYLSQKAGDGDYISSIFRAWKQYCGATNGKAGQRASFYDVIAKLKNDGVIEKFREEPGKHNFPRAYYRVASL